MKLLHFVWQNSARMFFLAILTSFASGLSNAALVALISQQFTESASISNRFIATLAGLVVFALLLDLAAKQLLNLLLSTVIYDLRRSLAGQILSTPFERLEKMGTSRLMALLTDDIRSIAMVMNTLPTLSLAFSTALGCMLYLAWLSPLTLLVLLLIASPIFLTYSFLQRQATQFWGEALKERNQLFAHYRSLTEGIKELTLHARRRLLFYEQLLQPVMMASKEKVIAARRRHYYAQSVNQFTYFVAIVLLLAVSRQFSVPIEVIAAYALIILYLKGATMTMVSALPQWTESNTTIDQIESLGFSLFGGSWQAAQSERTTSPLSEGIGIKLVLCDVEYKYRAEESTFHLGPLDLSFTPAAGELVFITGGNGSGKTTLMKLLIGLYTPQSGHIEFNGIPIGPANLENYRQKFTVVFAQPYLFSELLGLEQINPSFVRTSLDEQARAYLRKLQLEHQVSVDHGQLSTTKLSTGQRKRLALLTAYLEDRPIYIFDEWAASQDPIFKEIFYRQLLPELKARGKLIIVISHDDHYYDVADRIIKLDYGQIEEDK